MLHVASFIVHLRCANCLKDSVRRLDVPEAEEAPTSIDELLESNYLAEQRYACTRCDSAIATVTGVQVAREAA